jgi:gas vesicle protein
MITRKDIMEALGADTENRFITGMLVGLGLGAVVGGVVAMLFAPKTGPELRQMIGEKGSDLVAKARDKVGLGSSNAEQNP